MRDVIQPEDMYLAGGILLNRFLLTMSALLSDVLCAIDPRIRGEVG